MLAPRRVPPCFTASVAPLKTQERHGPDALPPVELTTASFWRRREKAKPVPRRLVDDGGGLHRVEDLLHGVPDREDVAGRVLELVPLPGVHERRRVRQELPVHHEVVEGARDLLDDGRALAPAVLPARWRPPPASTSPPGSPEDGPLACEVALPEDAEGLLRPLADSGGVSRHDRHTVPPSTRQLTRTPADTCAPLVPLRGHTPCSGRANPGVRDLGLSRKSRTPSRNSSQGRHPEDDGPRHLDTTRP